MRQAPLPPAPESGLFTVLDSLGIDSDAWPRALKTAGTTASLRDLDLVVEAVDVLREFAVTHMLRDGRTWAEVGHALGITRQAAHQRFRHLST